MPLRCHNVLADNMSLTTESSEVALDQSRLKLHGTNPTYFDISTAPSSPIITGKLWQPAHKDPGVPLEVLEIFADAAADIALKQQWQSVLQHGSNHELWSGGDVGM
jgi:hypothetical protein